MNRIAEKFGKELGTAGLVAIALIAFALAFTGFVTRPLEAQIELLSQKSSARTTKAQPGAEKVAAVYEFLAKPEEPTDWLAKLHGIGTATGIQMRSATYRTQPTEGRIVRYEIVLPVAGSYGQIRDFLKRAALEIPVLSIDQVTLKKEEKKGAALQAEMRLTLHMVKS